MILKPILAAALLLLLVAPASAQTAPQPEQIDKTVRASAGALAQAETLLLQIPDLVAQMAALREQNAKLQAEIARLKAPARPDAKPGLTHKP